ncbi:MAG: PEP-CTERM sorting domain-containing protein [Sedimentisphaerales bacterium]|nr:PEP-CTERM sorting domain-containing protein [Sedimentisphaerales bacterium]
MRSTRVEILVGVVIVSVTSLWLLVPSVEASVVSCEFTGSLTWVNSNNNPHFFELSDTFRGVFSYERNTADSDLDSGVGMYELSGPSEVYLLIDAIQYGTDLTYPEFRMVTYNDRRVSGGVIDQVGFQTYWPSPVTNALYMNFSDNTAAVLTDDRLPSVSAWLTPGLKNGSVSLFDENGQIAAGPIEITSAIPEPTTILLLGFGGVAPLRKRRQA